MSKEKREIIEVTERTSLGKRTRLTGTIIKSRCPYCDCLKELDLGDDQLEYAETNSPNDIYFSCSGDDESEHDTIDWSIQITIRMTLEVDDQRRDICAYGDEIRAELKEKYPDSTL